MTTPTDSEIIALADATRTAEGGANGYILPISFARALLAKWGQPQAVREPLTDEQINIAAEIEDNDSAFLAGFHGGARFAEAAHGITKGGQHGAE